MGELKIGTGTYGTVIRKGEHNSITIGKYCSISENCICDGGFGHNTRFVTTYPFNHLLHNCRHLTGHPVWKGDIEIGNDVWIGKDCVIMSGIKIGSGAVIGVRSIVTKDVEPYTIVAGSPAKPIRKRFTDEQIEKLLEIRWWDWPISEIIEASPLLMNEDIDFFIKKYG